MTTARTPLEILIVLLSNRLMINATKGDASSQLVGTNCGGLKEILTPTIVPITPEIPINAIFVALLLKLKSIFLYWRLKKELLSLKLPR